MSAASATPAMVGRRAELDQLLEALDAGVRGEPRAVIVRGEAGIGKTRLVQAAIEAAPVGAVIATGQCIDLGPIGAPFTPIRRLLHELYLGVGDEEFRAAAGSRAVVATIGRLIPELAGDEDAAAVGAGDYVAEAIERIFETLSATHHLVLALEDLHWADAATLALLKTLATTLRGSRITLIATYRSDDVGRGHPLRPVLAELERSRSVSFVDVARLDRAGVADLARGLLGSEPSADQVDALLTRSDGVPFFVEELVDLRDAPIPPTLRDVVLARFDRLSPNGKDVVGVIAVGGMNVDYGTLDSAWANGAAELHAGVREAVAESLLAAGENGYVFRHALIREAVYDDMLPHERTNLHRTYAEILQSAVDAGDTAGAAAAAEHWLAARENERAFSATLVARADAAQRFAYETAARLGERLLELWPLVDDAESRVGMSMVELCLAIAKQYSRGAAYRAGLRMVERGLALTSADDALTRARFHEQGGVLAKDVAGNAGTLAQCLSAEAELARCTDPAADSIRAAVFAMHAHVAPLDEAVALIEQATAIIDRIDDPETTAAVLRRRSVVESRLGRHEASLESLHRARALTAYEPILDSSCITNVVDELLRMGRFGEAIAFGEQELAAIIDAGLERTGGTWIHANIAEARLAVGQRDAGIAQAERAVRLLASDVSGWAAFALRLVALGYLWSNREDEFERTSAQKDRFGTVLDGDFEERANWDAVAADASLARAMDAAPVVRAQHIVEALRHCATITDDEVLESPEYNSALLIASARAIAAARLENVPVDAAMLASVERMIGQFTDEPWARPVVMMANALLADPDSQERAVQRWMLVTGATDERRVPCRIVHLARFELGRAQLAAGDKQSAIATFRRLIDESRADGIDLVAHWATRELAGTAVASKASGGPLGELTPRELEVLALIAQGLTNGEIGKRLFISTKTASVHVSAILAKLGATNRAEAASVYASVGLGA